MKAYCIIRDAPTYRRASFMAGLRAAGLEANIGPPLRPDKETILITWNRYAGTHETALQVERAGGRVWVAENGFIAPRGGSPKFMVHKDGPESGHHYALAQGWHNGGGQHWPGSPERFASMGIELKPWREKGKGRGHILVAPNRSFGVGDRLMHPDWAQRVKARLSKTTKREVVLRMHPGNDAPKRPLAADLEGAHAVIIWHSTSGTHALAEGIPVFCEAPFWMMKGAAASGSIEDPVCPDRLPVFEQMAWAQWTCEEIEHGTPFTHLLSGSRQTQVG